ncbi:hypothetical protein SLA2020_442030 [Shorea laevis]
MAVLSGDQPDHFRKSEFKSVASVPMVVPSGGRPDLGFMEPLLPIPFPVPIAVRIVMHGVCLIGFKIHSTG